MAKRRPIDEAALEGLRAAAPVPEAQPSAPTPTIERSTTWRYWISLFAIWRRRGATWLRDNLFFTLLLATGPLVVQLAYGLLHGNDFVSNAKPILIAYGVAFIVYVVAQVITIPALVHNLYQDINEQNCLDITRYFEPIVETLSAENERLRVQLKQPQIVPAIVNYQLEEIAHPPALAGDMFAALVPNADVLLIVTIELRNEHRVAAAVSSIEAIVGEGMSREIGTPENLEGLRIDLQAPIAFGVPRRCEARFMFHRKTIRSLVGNDLVIKVTDGTGQNVHASAPRRLA